MYDMDVQSNEISKKPVGTSFHVCRVLCMPDYKYMLLVKVISIAGDIY